MAIEAKTLVFGGFLPRECCSWPS